MNRPPRERRTDAEKDALLAAQAALMERRAVRSAALAAALATPQKPASTAPTPPSPHGPGRRNRERDPARRNQPRPARPGVSRPLAAEPDKTERRGAAGGRHGGADGSGARPTCRHRDHHLEVLLLRPVVTRVAVGRGRCGGGGRRDRAAAPAGAPGERRLPGAATIIKVRSRTELKDRCRTETRDFISSAILSAQAAADAVRRHWAIENRLPWVLNVVFADDQARLRTGHGAKNMAVVRHFAINLVRAVIDKKTIKLRRKVAGWDVADLTAILGLSPR